MKKKLIVLLTIIAFCIGCKKKQEKEPTFDLEKYVDIEFVQIEHEGKKMDLFKTQLAHKKDSIGKKIQNNHRRYEYLIANRIDNDSIMSVIKDTAKAKRVFYRLLNKKQFQTYFYTTFYKRNQDAVIFTEKELMKIASRFFLMEKNDNRFRTRVCIGINGLDNPDLKEKDYTILEAIVFEAIFEEITDKNIDEIDFMNNLDQYSKTAITTLDKTITDSLAVVRASVFNAMANDEALKTYLLSYLDENKDNIALNIVK